MEIDVRDYLDEEDMREIAREQFSRAVERQLSDGLEVERVISNIAYETVWRAVDDAVGEDAKALVAAKIPEVIDSLSCYSVFREADKLLREEKSVGQRILDEVVAENRPAIEARVREVIDGIDANRLREDIRDAIFDTVSEWIDGEG